MKRNIIIFLSMLTAGFLLLTGCDSNPAKTDDSDDGGSTSAKKALVIENGAQSISPKDNLTYSAVFVDENGSTSRASVEWSVTDGNVAAVGSNGTISVKGAGTSYVVATATDGNTTYRDTVPLSIYINTLWLVSPGAILGMEGDVYDLELVVFTMQSEAGLSFSYSSSSSSIASVNGSGVVTLGSTGNAVITVTDNNSNVFSIPVSVVGLPEVSLPVTQVKVSPATATLFRGDNTTLTAKAYDDDGNEKSADFTWSSADASIASVDNNGKVTGNAIGKTTIQATAKGISGQAEINVYPDTIVLVTPLFAEIAPGGSQQFTAEVYDARTSAKLDNVTNIEWTIPSFGEYSSYLDFMDFASVDANGNVTVAQNTIAGLQTSLIASVNGSETAMGASMIMVSIGGIIIPEF